VLSAFDGPQKQVRIRGAGKGLGLLVFAEFVLGFECFVSFDVVPISIVILIIKVYCRHHFDL
jgi:hypothetical protein